MVPRIYQRNTQSWNNNQISSDPILVAARAERWLISIHPYEHGNGRVSRFVMDWVLESLGLPAPILKDQNDDLYSTEAEWATQVGKGIMRAITTVENCALHPSASGCDALPDASHQDSDDNGQVVSGPGVKP